MKMAKLKEEFCQLMLGKKRADIGNMRGKTDEL